MTIQLGWNDLLIRNLAPHQCKRSLAHWSGLITGRVVPLYMSKFGDWFLRRPDGSTSELSVIEGTYSKIASTPDEFTALVNSPEWREDHLRGLLTSWQLTVPTSKERVRPGILQSCLIDGWRSISV